MSSEHCQLEDLSLEEQQLWNSFENWEIYEFLTGEPKITPIHLDQALCTYNQISPALSPPTTGSSARTSSTSTTDWSTTGARTSSTSTTNWQTT
jgi:hypothetical protein